MDQITIPEDNLGTSSTLPQWAAAPSQRQQVLIGLIFIAVWCLAEQATVYFETGPSISGWYLPAGLGLSLLWGLGLRYVWALGAAAWIGVYFIWGYGPVMATVITGLKVTTYSLNALLLSRLIPPGQVLQKPFQVIGAMTCMLIAPMLMALGGICNILLLSEDSPGSLAQAALGWWVGDTIGILATAPLIVMVLLPKLGRMTQTRFFSASSKGAPPINRAAGNPAFLHPLLISIGASGLILLLYSIPLTHSTRVFLLGFVVVPMLAVGYGLTGALLGVGAISVGGLIAISWRQMVHFEVVDLQLMMVALGVSAFFAGSFASMRQSIMASRLAGKRWATLALKGSRMGRWLWDVDQNRIYSDSILTTQLGYTPDQVKSDIAWWIGVTHKDDVESTRLALHQLVEGEIQTWSGERRLRAADGTWRWIHSYGTLVDDDYFGEGQMIVGIHHDITERKRLQQVDADAIALRHREELDAHIQRTEKLDAIGIFASGIAHDFHNTLLAINASAQSARKKIDDDHAAVAPLEVVEQACEQARKVTQSLLTFARGQGAPKELLDLKQTIKDTAPLLDALLPSTVTVTIQLQDDPEIWVTGNRSELQQVLMNLAMNSRDAMPEGGELKITLERSKNNTAQLHVADTGSGMTQAIADRAFEPFFTTKARLKGTGLGLSLVHGIITDHQGEVVIQSQTDKGTRVNITLPCRNAPHTTPTNSAPAETLEQKSQ